MLICEKKLNFSFALFQKILVLAQLVFIACKPYLWLYFLDGGKANGKLDMRSNNLKGTKGTFALLNEHLLAIIQLRG
jgi:hypothetical protein